MPRFDPAGRVRDLVSRYQDRHGRRARALASALEVDDDEVVLHPWQFRLPRTVVVAAARSRGLVPAGGEAALAGRGPWLRPLHLTRSPEVRR